ncbi:non-specific lipid-transfer protein 2 [Senna tora]|uniref:Non-specific lipid-transfer protein 2 n=1 Tax=Senna tora TaxID=362788 RepID=A0A834TG63_9FABA|nr:non-specific lipid-transfer protein 2 [Senna tora]
MYIDEALPRDESVSDGYGCPLCVGVLMSIAVILMVLVEMPHMAEAVTCSTLEMIPCLRPLTYSSPPSPICCQKVKLTMSSTFVTSRSHVG